MSEESTTERNREGKKEWVIKLQEQVMSLDIRNEDFWKKELIYKVPTYVKDLNIKAYEPKLVSLGPYHHGIPKLMAMEEHKYRALNYLLNRRNHPLSVYVDALEKIVEDLMGLYEQLDEKWTDRSRFLQLMILDGSFLLEILQGDSDGSTNPALFLESFFSEILQGIHFDCSRNHAKNDPIFSNNALLKNKDVMMEDMLMIENQVPLVVLATLLATEWGLTINKANELINIIVFCFFANAKFVFRLDLLFDLNLYQGLHLLDLTWQMVTDCLYERIPDFETPVILWSSISSQFFGGGKSSQFFSASYLYEKAQVKLKKSGANYLHGIRFEDDVLSLPIFRIHSTTESCGL